jgi:hypothetical protein
MSSLFCSRAGISVVGGGAFCRADWPLGKITLDAQALSVDALFKSYWVRLADIDCIRRRFLTVDVEHHASDVPGVIRLWGIRLFTRLREVIQRHQLRIEMSE